MFDKIDAKITVKITCIYIFKFFFLFKKIKDKGTKKIKTKASWISELFNPIRKRKK